MMTLKEKAAIIHYHRHCLGEYERGSVGALGYRNEDSQSLRFAVLGESLDFNGSSVLDIGCGYGGLKGWLDRQFHGFSYIGIDQMEEFIIEARIRYGQRPSCYFCIADFTEAELPQADYVIASNVLNYRCAENGFHFAMLEKMYRAADKALAFNMLDAAKFTGHPLLAGHDPEAMLAYCRTLSPQARLIRGYLEDDFTIVMNKEGRKES